ncbi:Trans-resveratrol di-O-methyltransferase [Sesamum alatum]|uniref:Trans-resveratrol di-O-methyltransferase n=1 Tax=Sesamum alatum TaxID=300844 RepID=A0AAE1YYS2_9LAMI|nr:Trans-resveratrol di-O-methyltransferase [Sesamum alatum]
MALPNNGIQSTQTLLDAQSHVWNHLFNFISSMSLKCVLQLGIPDIIRKHGKPMTLSELIHSLHLNEAKSGSLERLMRNMINSKFFINVKISEIDEIEGYWLTSASHLLLRDEPLSVRPFALAMLDPILTDPWHHVSEWFKTDDDLNPFVTTHGRTFWEHAGQEPRLNRFFNEGMASDAMLVANVITEECRNVFEGLKSMVDVGGGTGTVAKAVVDTFPGLNCVVLDLPHVVAGCEGTENLTFVAGDMFEYIPPADAVFMKWILHDWPDEKCLKILEKSKQAVSDKERGGKVIIVDMVVDFQKKHEAIETQLFFDMLMMNLTSGRERTEKEWAELFSVAGFTSYKITPVLELRSLIELFP